MYRVSCTSVPCTIPPQSSLLTVQKHNKRHALKLFVIAGTIFPQPSTVSLSPEMVSTMVTSRELTSGKLYKAMENGDRIGTVLWKSQGLGPVRSGYITFKFLQSVQ